MPSVDPGAVTKVKVSEHVTRFAFGGAVTALTGVVGHAFGPVVGGLFLAFPAILPATLKLVKSHDGRPAAEHDAIGAALGSVALAAFGLFVWRGAEHGSPVLVLGGALVVWLTVAVVAWAIGRPR